MPTDAEKRRFPRISFAGRIAGDVRPIIQGSVIDLSLGGACVEYREILRPGWVCDVTLRQRGEGIVSVRSRVAWANVERVEKRGRDRALVYRAGLEFVEVTAEQRAALQRILEAAEAGGPGVLRSLGIFLTVI